MCLKEKTCLGWLTLFEILDHWNRWTYGIRNHSVYLLSIPLPLSLFSLSADNLSYLTERIVLHIAKSDFTSQLTCLITPLFLKRFLHLTSKTPHSLGFPWLIPQAVSIGIFRAHSMDLFSSLLSIIPLLISPVSWLYTPTYAIDSYIYCCNLDISRTAGFIAACLLGFFLRI